MFVDLFEDIQKRTWAWCEKMFHDRTAWRGVEERGRRFFEEATELVQVVGLSKEDLHKIIDYVYSRPVGDVRQEIGGTMVCLALLAEGLGLNVGLEYLTELKRVENPSIWEKIRSKQFAKNQAGIGGAIE